MSTLATPANMRAVEAANPSRPAEGGGTIMGRRAVAFSPLTGEECSASAGDYWNLPDDAPLIDSEGEPMVLVFERTAHVDALTGEVV